MFIPMKIHSPESSFVHKLPKPSLTFPFFAQLSTMLERESNSSKKRMAFMKLPHSDRRSHPPAKEINPPMETNLARQLALTNAQTLLYRMAKTQRNLRLSALFVGILLVVLIIPASPLRQALGYGGGSGIVNPTCGQPFGCLTFPIIEEGSWRVLTQSWW
jgi:hypothetical protein